MDRVTGLNRETQSKCSNAKTKLAAGVVLSALLIVPAPLLPPHRLAEVVQSVLGVGWKAAYLVAALGLQIGFYSSLGVLAALAVHPALTLRGQLLQIGVVPLVVGGVALIVRSVKLGQLPVWANAVIPVIACVFGVRLGLPKFHVIRHGEAGLGAMAQVNSINQSKTERTKHHEQDLHEIPQPN